MDHGGSTPSDGQAAQHVEREPVAPDGGGKGHQDDEDLDQALQAAG